MPACEAVGAAASGSGGIALGTVDGGGAWSTQRLPPGTGVLRAVACGEAGTCVAVGSNDLNTFGIALHRTDGHWSRADDQLPAGVLALNAVACPSKSVCEALGLRFDAAVVIRTT